MADWWVRYVSAEQAAVMMGVSAAKVVVELERGDLEGYYGRCCVRVEEHSVTRWVRTNGSRRVRNG